MYCEECGNPGSFKYQALICDNCFDEKLYENSNEDEGPKTHDEISFLKEDVRLLRIFKI